MSASSAASCAPLQAADAAPSSMPFTPFGADATDADVIAAVRELGGEDSGVGPNICNVANIVQVFRELHTHHKLVGWFDGDDDTGKNVVMKQVFAESGAVSRHEFIAQTRFRIVYGPHAGRVLTAHNFAGADSVAAAVRASKAALLKQLASLRGQAPVGSEGECLAKVAGFVLQYTTCTGAQELLDLMRRGGPLPLREGENAALDCKDMWWPPAPKAGRAKNWVSGWGTELEKHAVAMLNSQMGRGALLLGVVDKSWNVGHCDATLEELRNGTADLFKDCNPPLFEGSDYGFYELTPPPRRVVLLAVERAHGAQFLYKDSKNSVHMRSGPSSFRWSGADVFAHERTSPMQGWKHYWAKSI